LIQEEAHEDANIIFGAVIDEKIADEIHVTVIATGFGEREHEWHSSRYSSVGTPITAPVQAVSTRPIDLQPQPMPSPPPSQSQMFHGKPVRRLGMIIDESTLDIPAFKRRNSEQGAGPIHLGEEGVENDDKLDIPAFLRKQPD
ncbi:MAG: hypothetical protein JOZ29_17650, partial [Deltaproteobacteria bacterium]|nr:hypothetical protein [Deltaproteobacteria bacterium]